MRTKAEAPSAGSRPGRRTERDGCGVSDDDEKERQTNRVDRVLRHFGVESHRTSESHGD
ncbi:MAG: hypothetical protein U5J64_05925 [Halobacteriales archaeon]|nr:hypothetical protein [Halobacteriales archaeon]